MLIFDVFVTIVPASVPNSYFIVCVKLLLALLILIVVALPIFPSAHVIELARGTVLRFTVVEPVKVPALIPVLKL